MGRLRIRKRSIVWSLALTAGLVGCASTNPSQQDIAQATSPTQTASLADNPDAFTISHSGSPSTSIGIEIGPYQTSRFGHYTGLKKGKEPIRCADQVSFSNDRMMYVFDISNSIGEPVHVQVGFEKTNETVRQLGFIKREKGGDMYGAVTRGNQLIGRFTLPWPKTNKFGIPVMPEQGEEHPLSEISTPSGLIQHYSKHERAEGRPAVQKLFLGDGSIVSEYRINDRVVARRDLHSVWFDESLPHDTRMCLVAEISIHVLRERTAQNVQNAGELNTSVMLLTR